MSTRLTKTELEAIEYALTTALVGELDGFDPADDGYDEMQAACESALRKIEERLN